MSAAEKNGTPRWLQGVTVGWTVLEFALLGFMMAGWIFGWPLGAIADVLWSGPNALFFLTVSMLVFFYLGDIVTLFITYKIKKENRTARLSKTNGPIRLFMVHLLPGISLAHRLVFGTFIIVLGLVQVISLLVWDAAFLFLAIPLRLAGGFSEKFGKATDAMDVVRESVKLALQRLHTHTAPY